ncbi:hypothetical protein VNO77_09722 [Canavalia gladiata]|uniref:RRM domain-containing protein n=1 Tax=Canavalia gladiata TaxID=3824 RepID=A0AAN9QX68_CANGL
MCYLASNLGLCVTVRSVVVKASACGEKVTLKPQGQRIQQGNRNIILTLPSFALSAIRYEAIMELTNSGLIMMAKKLESQKLAMINFTSDVVNILDRLLCDTFDRLCPKPIDYHNRRDLVRIFNMIAKEIYGDSDDTPVVQEYGSFVMDMFDGKSDLDLSINFNDSAEVPRQKQISTLKRFDRKLHRIRSKGHVTGLQSIKSARVPIIKVTDSGTGIECDLSVDNREGIKKSHIIRAISAIDERFRKLSFLMKCWAKAHDINSPKDQTLSSFSIVSFVAFHLQTCNPPILPPFSVLLKEGDDPESVAKVVETYLDYGKRNEESLAKLFITLFVKLASVEKLWQSGLCVSLYEGSWILKSWKSPYPISVEDFTDRSQNVARAVGGKRVTTIYNCINKSLASLEQFLNGKRRRGNKLMDVLFGTHTVPTPVDGITSNIRENKNNLPTMQNPRPPRKRRLLENQGGSWMQHALGETVDNMLASFAPPVSVHRKAVAPPPYRGSIHLDLPQPERKTPFYCPDFTLHDCPKAVMHGIYGKDGSSNIKFVLSVKLWFDSLILAGKFPLELAIASQHFSIDHTALTLMGPDQEASEFIVTYPVHNVTNKEGNETAKAVAWEKSFIQLVKVSIFYSYVSVSPMVQSRNFTLAFSSESSIEEELKRESAADAITILVLLGLSGEIIVMFSLSLDQLGFLVRLVLLNSSIILLVLAMIVIDLLGVMAILNIRLNAVLLLSFMCILLILSLLSSYANWAMEEETEDSKMAVRIFVGGLGEGVSAEDLRRLFASLGTVQGIETIRTKGRSFAYLDFLTDPKSLSKLFSKYNGCLWKGGKLRLEKAKENYLTRLKREWEQDALGATQPPSSAPKDLEEMPNTTHISKPITKHLRIFFPKLKKVKSIPFSGTGKHKYSFQNIKVPALPVHFCDCEEHCSPFVTEREKLSFRETVESGGMNDEEINVMNAVMNKLFEKEKVSNAKNLGEEHDSFDSRNVLHYNECETDSATDEDDLIINVETKKNKSALIGTPELKSILEKQESWLNITKNSKKEPNKSMPQVQKRSNISPDKIKKRKSLPKLERENSRGASTTPGSKSNMRTLSDEVGSGAQPPELEDGFGELTKVSWSQKSSWRELLGDGGNTAFSASFILPKFDLGKNEQSSDDLHAPLSTNNKTESTERDGYLGNEPTNTESIKEFAKAQPTNKQVIEDLAESQQNAAPNKTPDKTGRGASWLQKQSWTQLVGENINSFSISQILPGITLPEPIAKEPVVDAANSNDCKHNDEAMNTSKEAVSDRLNLGQFIPDKGQHVGAHDIASALVVEKKIETSPREKKSTEDVEIGQTCSFMRSAASLKEWSKAKTALSKSLKRKRGEK